MFRLKCDHCGQEILISEHCEKFPMICGECGGCLVIVEDLRKSEQPVVIPYPLPPEPTPPHPDVFPYIKTPNTGWTYYDNTTHYYSGTAYTGTYTVNSGTGNSVCNSVMAYG